MVLPKVVPVMDTGDSMNIVAPQDGRDEAAPGAPSLKPGKKSKKPKPCVPCAPTGATAIRVRSDRLQVVDAAGAILHSVTYFDPIVVAVAAISAATGSAPVITPHSGGIESAPGTYYRWGGLQLNDSNSSVAPPLEPEWFVRVDGPTADGLPVTTAAGVSVGQSQVDVEALVPGTLQSLVVAGETVLDGRYEETVVGHDSGADLTHSVFVRLEGVPLGVTVMLAPARNYGS
ncbi:hypothetical protein [Agromyces neolithicus]|uniref:Uncharacterized protein n=1 Tax=Agromyces neolithicus TaxID=269420 RepID=A0ABN2M5G0_9MICO